MPAARTGVRMLLLLGAIPLASGCGSQAPTFTLEQAGLEDATATGSRVGLRLAIDNPNPVELRVDRFEYRVERLGAGPASIAGVGGTAVPGDGGADLAEAAKESAVASDTFAATRFVPVTLAPSATTYVDLPAVLGPGMLGRDVRLSGRMWYHETEDVPFALYVAGFRRPSASFGGEAEVRP